MARRDITGAVDFGYLERYVAGDTALMEEVLVIFREQADIWRAMLAPDSEGWRDAIHTLKGSARRVGAFELGHACENAEPAGPGALPQVQTALDAALFDICAFKHELARRALRG